MNERFDMEFAPDSEMQKMPDLAKEFFEHILHDEQPLFVSDEATIWDVSMSLGEELLDRCSKYYRVPVSMADLNQPLWKLIRQLNDRMRLSKGPCNSGC